MEECRQEAGGVKSHLLAVSSVFHRAPRILQLTVMTKLRTVRARGVGGGSPLRLEFNEVFCNRGLSALSTGNERPRPFSSGSTDAVTGRKVVGLREQFHLHVRGRESSR